MTIYHDSTYDGWSDEVDSGGIGEYMMGVTQRHDLPGSMTPGAPYTVGHEVRSHRYESLEERQSERRSSDPQELLDSELTAIGGPRPVSDPVLEATRLTAIDLGLSQGFVERVVNGSLLEDGRHEGCGDPRHLSARVIDRYEARLKRINR